MAPAPVHRPDGGGDDCVGEPMNLARITPFSVMQLGWTVFEDIEDAILRWVKLTGAGPFFVLRHVPMVNCVHRGISRAFDHDSAIGQWGDMQIELMHQRCDNLSHLRDLSPDGQTRMASVSWMAPDVDIETRRMAGLGFPVVFHGNIFDGSMSATWFDTSSVLGCYAEVFADSPVIRMAAERCRQASQGWDGRDPIRSMSDLLVAG